MTEPTTLPGVTVIGQRPIFGIMIVPTKGEDGGVHQQEVSPDGDGGDGGRPATQAEVEAEEKRQKDCAAEKFRKRLQEKSDRNSKEYFSFTFVRNGEIVTSDLQGGAGATITGAEISAAMSQLGITSSDLLGFNHNHPSGVYCNDPQSYTRYMQEIGNAYPSAPDWNAATNLLNPDQDGAFSMYVTGCDGVQREFPYSGRVAFGQARDTKASPPPPVQPLNCPQG